MSEPSVEVLGASGETRAVVLVLHGGKASSHDPSEPRHLSVARLVPFAEQVHALTAPAGVATWRVRYRLRGWNGAEASPVEDARWALEEVRRRHGEVPVVLLGHSMGGRTALRVCDDPAVRHVVALAPWLPSGEPVGAARGRRVVIAHAPTDRWTYARESREWADRAAAVADRVVYVAVRRAGHFMLRRSPVWHSVAQAFVLDALGDAGVTPPDLVQTVRGPGANLVAEAASGRHSLRV